MIGEPNADLDAIVHAALAEDVGDGDRTTAWTVPPEAEGSARIVARAEGRVAGVAFADRVFEVVDDDLARDWMLKDGAGAGAGDTLVRIRGSLASILVAERTALNGLARLSGIATATAEFVRAVEGTGATLIDTRKTTPGWRALEKRATLAGGARNHRMGLFDMVLIKENHVRAAGGIRQALDSVRAGAAREGLQVEIEVSTLAELEDALSLPPDRILLDNMDVHELRLAVQRVSLLGDSRPLLEASGGIDMSTVRSVAETGVDFVSVGAITHSAPALDLSMLVDR
ncbi:MAG: carboxylating nicotinate-nucleotide diphosphorylase [Gemmatimonadota bacterium]